jgi:hypothetical protein
MPTRSYPLTPTGQEKITVTWQGYFNAIEVALNGKILATFDNKKDVRDFQSIAISPNVSLDFRIRTAPELQIDGIPLRGSAGDPIFRVRHAYIALYIYGLLTMFIGSIVSGIGRIEEVLLLGNLSIIVGILFVALGILAQRGVKSAFIIASVLLLAHIASIIFLPENNATRIGGNGYGGMALSGIILIFVLRALPYLKRYRYFKFGH